MIPSHKTEVNEIKFTVTGHMSYILFISLQLYFMMAECGHNNYVTLSDICPVCLGLEVFQIWDIFQIL